MCKVKLRITYSFKECFVPTSVVLCNSHLDESNTGLSWAESGRYVCHREGYSELQRLLDTERLGYRGNETPPGVLL